MLWKIAVCEDDPAFRDQLKSMIAAWAEQGQIELQLAEFSDTHKLLGALEGPQCFDAFFLDIETPSPMSGLELADAIRDINREAPIVFVTSHGEFAHRGYYSNALNYLIKPIDEAVLHPVLERVAERLDQIKGGTMIFKIGGEMRHFNCRDIASFTSDAHYIRINNDPELRFRGKIDELLVTLPAHFIRIHQSIVINLDYIYQLRADSVILDDATRSEHLVSSRYRIELRQAYHRYYSNFRPPSRT